MTEAMDGALQTAALLDLLDMPGFNPVTQSGGRGEWGLRCVSDGTVYEHPTWHVACVDHGAMNTVNEDATIWRCLTCGRGAYRPQRGSRNAS